MTFPDRVKQRALSHVVVSGDCLLSTYSLNHGGYGQISWRENGKAVNVSHHRIMWEIVNGPIPDGLTVDHMIAKMGCLGPQCVKPEHLRLLSLDENSRRRNGQDWPLGFCSKGHSNDEQMMVGKRRRRVCRSCRKEWVRVYKERKRIREAQS